MLPSLHNLSAHGPGGAHDTDIGMPAAKRKRDDDDADDPIFFKAFKSGRFRKLSNLFGPVEWAFQRQKFKEGSAVYNFLLEGERKTRAGEWTVADFDAARLRMKHDGKLASYVDDGVPATGLLAQMTSLIAKNPDSTDARHRLAYIMGRSETDGPVIKAEMAAWHAANLNPPLEDNAKWEFMLQLLQDKYTTNDAYRALLLSTRDRVLHEAKGRGQPSVWEHQPLTPAQLEKGFWPGGDWLGKLLTVVRANLQAL